MASTSRRTPSRGPGPRGSTRPGTRGTTSRSRPAAAAPAPARTEPRRPRFTGRAAILVLVLAVLTISYASSLRAFLQQKSHIDELRTQIAETEAGIDGLEREKRRWRDDAYVQAQARQRFGFVMPGETSYQVIDENGEPLGSSDQLSDPDEIVPTDDPVWWESAWESVEAAGNPPKPAPEPTDRIDPPARKIQ